MKLFYKLSSLKLTIACLLGAMVLVLLGTFEQMSTGVFAAQEMYFRSVFLYWKPESLPFAIPWFPGGVSFGVVLLFNLIAGFITRFRFTPRSIGIFLVHVGLALLVVGEILTGMLSKESQIVMRIGDAVNYSVNPYEVELVLTETSHSDTNQVVTVSQKRLSTGSEIILPNTDFPFTLKIQKSYPNSQLLSNDEVRALPQTKKDHEINVFSAFVEVVDGDSSLGTWLLSRADPNPRSLTIRDKQYEMEIRPKRYYFPYSIELADFTHDRYPGTDIPSNFVSSVKVYTADGQLDREAKISMNHPLRYAGKAYYQASYGENDTLSVLQVVDNPSRLTPYISSTLVSAGLLIQFFMSFYYFRKRNRK